MLWVAQRQWQQLQLMEINKMTHEEKMEMRTAIYKHAGILLSKVQRMFDSGDLTPSQMAFGGDLLKDIASIDKNLSKACYYENKKDFPEDKKY